MPLQDRVALSIIIPIYNEEGNIITLLDRLRGVAKSITDSYELIFVNDGGED